jgi:SAM-dependent methyltransferase
VYAVEPNLEMRAKAEELLSGYPGFVSVDGTAEATGLPDSSVDLILAGQAFHWFDPVATRREFVRIARPGAVVALIWNERLILSDFEKEYEELILEYAGDYKTINHKNITDDRIGAFFHPASFVLAIFENEQRFDFEGLKGRLLSSSYIPKEGLKHDGLMKALAALFDRYQSGGRVRIGYETKLYTGVIK